MARTPRSVRSALKTLTCVSSRAIPGTDEPKERYPLCHEKRGTQRPLNRQMQREQRKPQQKHRPKKLKQAAATTSTAMLVSLRPRRTARSVCSTCANREIGVPRQTKNGAAPATIRPVAYATWLLGCDERRLSGFN